MGWQVIAAPFFMLILVQDIMTPQLQGNRVFLRQPKQGDLEKRLFYGRDAEIVRMFGGNTQDMPPLSVEEASKLHSLNEQNHRAQFALGFYDHSKLGKGLGQEVTRLVLGYAFGELHLHRVDLRVLAYNVRAIHCYQECGFTIEGKERESAYVDGKWHDDLIMAILAHEFISQPL